MMPLRSQHRGGLEQQHSRQGLLGPGNPQCIPRAMNARCRGRAQTTTCAKSSTKPAATRATVAVGASPPAPMPEAITYAVKGSTVYAGVLFLAMILLPRVAAVRKAMQSYWLFAPLALVYLALLAFSWTPDTLSTLLPGSLAEGLTGGFNPQFFPRLDAISTLFSQPATAASLLLHVLAINLFLGRTIYLEGLAKGIPTAHSLSVSAILGPVGMLIHWITKAIFRTPGLRPDSKEQVLDVNNGGRITILPYDG